MSSREIVAERGLLARARRSAREKARRAEAAQIRHDDPAAGGDERRHHVVVAARIVRPAVQEQDRHAVRGAALSYAMSSVAVRTCLCAAVTLAAVF